MVLVTLSIQIRHFLKQLTSIEKKPLAQIWGLRLNSILGNMS